MTENDRIKDETEFDEEVYEALRAAGWTFPETPAEVEQVEQERAENHVELPEHLSDAAKVSDMIHTPLMDNNPERVLPVPRTNGVLSDLAQAAREGGEISEDLAERMRQDRKKARDQANEQ